jgi:hypothetical protein
MASVAPAIPEVQPSRSFNALSGLELKTAILKQIQRQLDADTRFSQHLTYARISWRWRMAIDFYPNDMDQKFESETGADQRPPAVNEAGVPRREIAVDEKPIQVDISGDRTVAAPIAGVSADQARRESGQPVPTTKIVAGPEGSRIAVDAPEIPVPGHNDKSEVIEGSRVETNVPGAKGTVARRATIRNRANPTGVAVAPTAGSAPTEEDMQKIIDQGLSDGTLTKATE